MNIVITKDGFWCLMNVFIINPTHRNLLMCFDDDSTCSNSYGSKQGAILHRTSARRWFHSPCHKDLRFSSSLFWFFFYFCVHANIAHH
jgi:hypothetical protein